MNYVDIFDAHENVRIIDERDNETLFMLHFETAECVACDVAVLVIDEGNMWEDNYVEYYPTDWQGQQPASLDEVGDYEWVRGEDIDF